ncbi:RIP metalloprotease RseP [Bacteroidales bacterium OttesenSCG-928-M11]|nr:RIP metalloprotease RseP [Bacteroidales bacterium OttesenSCG-928-M11]
MEEILIRAAQLILSLSILVIVHEMGHFFAARLFKVRVEKFYLFFNPGFTLFKYKPKNSETEYGIGWLPLGGYVKIAGMIDESMDKEAMAQPAKPYEFRSKPAWQRLIIMIAGVFMNFVLAFFIYSMVVFYWGRSYVPLETTPLYFSSVAKEVGFQDGDILLSADGEKLTRYDDLDLFKIIDGKEVVVNRQGVEKTILLPENFKSIVLSSKSPIVDVTPAIIDSIVPNSNAEKAGMLPGDKILSINGKETSSFSMVGSELRKNKKEEVAVTVLRENKQKELIVSVDEEGIIGFTSKMPDVSINQTFNFFESIPAGIEFGWRKLSFYVLQLKLIFTKEGVQSLGGFGAIGSLFPAKWDWYSFWSMTAFISLILGVMNLLPIPALDGGHVLFLLYEVITRRTPNEKFMEYAQIFGMVLLFGLLIYANGMDIIRAFF